MPCLLTNSIVGDVKKLFAGTMRVLPLVATVSILLASSAEAAAPDGIGPVKIGMTLAQLEKLTEGKYAVKNLQLASTQNIPGLVQYRGELVSPITLQPASAGFNFKDSRLIGFYVTVEEREYDEIIQLLSAKYGKPTIVKNWKDEQCIYKSGNSFIKRNGEETFRWRAALPGQLERYASVRTYIFDPCPVDLRLSFSSKVEVRSLRIGVQKVVQKDNPF